MTQNIYRRFIYAAGIALTLSACNQGENKEAETTTTDTTAISTTTETAPPPAAEEAGPDATQAAPNLYKVLNDSAGIRIVEVNYKPGDSSAMHGHPANALYIVQGGTVTFIGKDGSTVERTFPTGATAVRPAEAHSVKNTGKTALKAILVEVTRPMGTASQDAAMDAAKVSPNLYKVKNDSLGLRILEINYKPGQSSEMHGHPDAALYVIRGSTSEFTMQDGSKQTATTLKAGTTMIMPAGVHSVKNVGKTPTKAILVEVNRPRQ